MKRRLERKYLVANNRLKELRMRMAPFIRSDIYAENNDPDNVNEYVVRSIYFDTVRLFDYYQKIEGVKERKKIRLRGYNHYRPGDLVFLEIKRKDLNRVWKNRAPVPYSDINRLFATSDIDSLVPESKKFPSARSDARKFFYYILAKSLRPINLVVYDREPYHGIFNPDVRITFDKNLRSMMYPRLGDLFADELDAYGTPGHFILEIKYFDDMPRWARSLVAEFGLMREALSKYCMCLESHGLDNFSRTEPLALSAAV